MRQLVIEPVGIANRPPYHTPFIGQRTLWHVFGGRRRPVAGPLHLHASGVDIKHFKD